MFRHGPCGLPAKRLYDYILIMSPFLRPYLKEVPSKEPSRIWGFLMRVGTGTAKFLFLAVCACATAFLFKISYPKPSYSLLMWLALAPFTLAVVRLRGFWSSFFYSWLTGVLVFAGLYYWVYITCLYGGGMTPALSLTPWLGLSAVMALQFAVFGGSCFYLKRLQWAFPVLAALGWTALEWGHEMLASYSLGFPWFTLGYSQWNLPQIIQVASLAGTAGVSCLVAFCGVSVGYAFATPSLRRGIGQLLLAAAVFLGAYGYGAFVLSHKPAHSLLSLHTAVLQPNIDQYKKWSPEFEQEILNTVSDMGAQLAGKNIMLAVWPESVTPGPVQEEPYLSLMQGIAKNSGAWQLAGSNRAEDGKQYVSAFLFSPSGADLSWYDKTHLVPFGEYIPFEQTVRSLLPNVEVLGELGTFSAGEWEQPLLQINQIPFGQTICYESVFSRLWKAQVKAGARFFINITNDAWFFDTDAPYQHLAVAVLRAAETRRPVLRAANTGISAVISASGEILARAELNTRAMLTAEVPLPLGAYESFYVRWGEWFSWICAAIYFTILISTMVFAYEY